jgi:hypothetical protein
MNRVPSVLADGMEIEALSKLVAAGFSPRSGFQPSPPQAEACAYRRARAPWTFVEGRPGRFSASC